MSKPYPFYCECSQNETLLVWDSERTPEKSTALTVLWQNSVAADSANQVSIARIVEDRAEVLRSRYLAWIHDVGESKIDGRRVIDHLILRPGLSFWWMTSLPQQFNLGSRSGINDTLKAFALEELINEHSTAILQLQSANEALARCLADLCHRRGIIFNWLHPNAKIHQPYFDRCPTVIRALAYLLWYSFQSLPMLIRRPVIPVSGGVLFMDVLVHLDREALAEGHFRSNYWTSLVSRLNEWKVSCLWGHLFFRHSEIGSLSSAAKHLGHFNRNALPDQGHFLIEHYFSPTVFLNSLRDYWRIARAMRRLGKIKLTGVPNSQLNPGLCTGMIGTTHFVGRKPY